MPCTDVEAFSAAPPEQSDLYQRGVSPTAFGLFPHYLRLFVQEKGVLSLEEAIRKATSVPAQDVLSLTDRGVLREGAYADIVVLDLENLQEGQDFLNPTQPPSGIQHVLVNGSVVYEGMAHTGAKPGQMLRRS
jgi:N-acyl-D-aspartate/D-glutamate deacylase